MLQLSRRTPTTDTVTCTAILDCITLFDSEVFRQLHQHFCERGISEYRSPTDSVETANGNVKIAAVDMRALQRPRGVSPELVISKPSFFPHLDDPVGPYHISRNVLHVSRRSSSVPSVRVTTIRRWLDHLTAICNLKLMSQDFYLVTVRHTAESSCVNFHPA